MDKIKLAVTAVISALMAWLGILAVPVFLLVGCNCVDYATGLCAVKYRRGQVTSYKSIKGITKKVCQWLLILVGVWIDILINYAVECTGINITIPFVVATVVAVWLVINEIISILENMLDIGVNMPPFMLPVIKYIKRKLEDKAAVIEDKEEQEDE